MLCCKKTAVILYFTICVVKSIEICYCKISALYLLIITIYQVCRLYEMIFVYKISGEKLKFLIKVPVYELITTHDVFYYILCRVETNPQCSSKEV